MLECCLPNRSPAIGLPTTAAGAVSVSCSLSGPTVRRALSSSVSSSGLVSSSEFLRHPPGLAFRSGLPARVSSLFAASPAVSTCRGSSPAPATFRPRVFSTPRRLPPPLGFAGLFHPAATSRVLSVQGLLPFRSRTGSSPAVAPLPFPSSRSPASRLPRRDGSASRSCSAERSVRDGRGLAGRIVAPLFGFSLLQAPRDRRDPVPRTFRS